MHYVTGIELVSQTILFSKMKFDFECLIQYFIQYIFSREEVACTGLKFKFGTHTIKQQNQSPLLQWA